MEPIKYRPELDGLRAVAVALVMVFHANLLPGGYIGVDVFFVLSGYLITTILLRELSRDGINLKQFYWRRFLRLAPPLSLFLLLYLASAPRFWTNYDNHGRDAIVSFFYLSDYGYVFFRVPEYIRHTWSLAVEEHFYLVWPLALIMLYRLPKATTIMLICYIAATLWRLDALNWSKWHEVYYRFDMRLSGLLAGSLLAMLKIKQYRQFLFAAIPAVAVILYSLFAWGWEQHNGLIWGVMAAELATALFIISGTKGVFGWKPLVYIGKLSYGLYLYHYPIMFYLRDHSDPWTTTIVGSALSFLLAAASYHTIEAWVREYKSNAKRL